MFPSKCWTIFLKCSCFFFNLRCCCMIYVTPNPTSKILSALAHGLHRFVFDSHAWPQNASYWSRWACSYKALPQVLSHQCGILQFTHFKELDDPVGTIGQPVSRALIPNVTLHPISKILFALVHGPRGFVLDNHAWPQNASY